MANFLYSWLYSYIFPLEIVPVCFVIFLWNKSLLTESGLFFLWQALDEMVDMVTDQLSISLSSRSFLALLFSVMAPSDWPWKVSCYKGLESPFTSVNPNKAHCLLLPTSWLSFSLISPEISQTDYTWLLAGGLCSSWRPLLSEFSQDRAAGFPPKRNPRDSLAKWKPPCYLMT